MLFQQPVETLPRRYWEPCLIMIDPCNYQCNYQGYWKKMLV
jgi:hypothetical protein